MKIICSRKCAKPCISGGSLKVPTPTLTAHAAYIKDTYTTIYYKCGE